MSGRQPRAEAPAAARSRHPAVVHAQPQGRISREASGPWPMVRREGTGLWERFIPGVKQGGRYKFRVTARGPGGRYADKADPFAFHAELAPHRDGTRPALTGTVNVPAIGVWPLPV